ncbi:hypothetical protein BC830DRAFT_111313 [Chytriomyces sp. MP71]|nr:hypothetical protein BC830DRAFT_111313 [Chytriomyces sp. MP71]
MGGYTMGLAAKAPCIKSRIAIVDSATVYGDSNELDASESQRAKMRSTPNGPNRQNRTFPYSSKEVGAHSANYADETPPPWITNHQTDFPPKSIGDREAIKAHAKECIEYIKASHFELDYGETEQMNAPPISTTKRDYPGKYAVPERKEGPKTKYPPIYRDESQGMISSSIYGSAYIPRVTPTAHIVRPNATASHFTLGDDNDATCTFKSVTKSAYNGFNQTTVKLMKDEQKRSTVLDNPDGEPGETTSVQQTDYTLPKNLDRSSLKVDNTLTVKDLRATHFTLGNDDTVYSNSQYQTSYLPVPSSYINDNLHSKVNHYKTCVNLQDDDDLEVKSMDKKSTHHRDYKSVGEEFKRSVLECRQLARELEHIQNASSILFTHHSHISPTTRSITKTDFTAPNRAAYPAHHKNPVEYVYSPINGDARSHANRFDGASVMKSSYIHFCDPDAPAPAEGEVARSSQEVRDNFMDGVASRHSSGKNLRGHHFMLGTDELAGRETSMGTHYQSPDLGEYKKHMCAKAGKEWSFDSTLENTVTRYPKDNTTYQTVNNTTYVTHTNCKPPAPFRPAPLSFLNHNSQ